MTPSLPPNPSLRFLREQAKDLLKAYKASDASCCEVLRKLNRFADATDADILAADISLKQVQFALAMDYGFKSWGDLIRDVRLRCEREETAEDTTFAPYRLVPFSVRGPFCSDDECAIHPDLTALRFQVKEVHGTSHWVAVGERYTVTGEYELPGTDLYSISVAVCTKAFGAGADLQPGAGRFDISTEILDLVEGAPNALGIVVKNEKTGRCDIVRWVMLKDRDAEA